MQIAQEAAVDLGTLLKRSIGTHVEEHTAVLETLPSASVTWRKVLALAWPVLAQQFLILLVSLSDNFLAGRFSPMPLESGAGSNLHVSYQSAQTTAHYFAWLIGSYMLLVSVGSAALVARYIGAGDRRMARRIVNQSILIAIVLGLVGGIVGLIFRESLVSLVQLRGHSVTFASDYLRPYFLLLVFQVIESAGIACLVGAGDTRAGMWVLGGVTLINLPLAWLFFHGAGPIPRLGFEGIALGTAISHTLGGVLVLVLLVRGRAGLRLDLRRFWPDWPLIGRLLWISGPAGLDSLTMVLGQLWFLSIVNRMGDVASTAHGIAICWEALGYQSAYAFGTAAMALVGQNLGARQPKEAARSGWIAFGMGCGFMCLMGLVFFMLAPQMFALFCPSPEQAAVIPMGVPVLRMVAFAMPALASCIIFSHALRGAGDTRIPALFTWIGFLGIRIPLAYLLTLDHLNLGQLGSWPTFNLGLFGAWLAMFMDLVLRGSFFLWRFLSGRWQNIRV